MREKLRYGALFAVMLVGLAGLSVGLYELLRDARLDLPSAFIQVAMWSLFAFLVLLILRYVGLLWFSYLNHLERDDAEPRRLPPVTILVPAYNEGAVIQGSIRSLLELDYPRIAKIFREHNYRGYVSLEFEGKEDPKEAIPKSLALLRSAFGGTS